MDRQELTERVVSIVVECQKLAPGRVTADSSFADLGIDSLDGVNLLFAFEEAFDINIPEHVAQEMKSVRQVVEGLEKVLAKRAAAAGEAAPVAVDDSGENADWLHRRREPESGTQG